MQLVQAMTQWSASSWGVPDQEELPLVGLAAHFTDTHDLIEYAGFDRLKGLALHPNRIPGVQLNGARMVGSRGLVPIGFHQVHKRQSAPRISAMPGALSFPELVFMWRARPRLAQNRLLVVAWQDPDHMSKYDRDMPAYVIAMIEQLHDGTTELYVDYEKPGEWPDIRGVVVPYWFHGRRT